MNLLIIWRSKCFKNFLECLTLWCLISAFINNIVAKKTTEIVLLFHKNTTKLLFLWPNMGQKIIKVLIITTRRTLSAVNKKNCSNIWWKLPVLNFWGLIEGNVAQWILIWKDCLWEKCQIMLLTLNSLAWHICPLQKINIEGHGVKKLQFLSECNF